LPLDSFGKDKIRKDGLNFYCRLCVRARSAKFREDNPEKGAISSAKYQAKNPDKRKEIQRNYRLRNADSVKAREMAYLQENPEKRKETSRKYYAENRDRVATANLKWAANNPGNLTARAAKRRALKRNATVPWADLSYVGDLYENCRETEEIFQNVGVSLKFHVDHIVPLQHARVCGLHVEHNLQILTATDNLSKNNHFELEDYPCG
jgi:hypothetical protein